MSDKMQNEEIECARCGGTGMLHAGDAERATTCRVCNGRGMKRTDKGPAAPPTLSLVPQPTAYIGPVEEPTVIVIVGPSEQVQILRQKNVPAGEVRVLTAAGKLTIVKEDA